MVKKRKITAEDLYRFELIAQARISPDGAHVVYDQHRMDRETEKMDRYCLQPEREPGFLRGQG